MKSSIYFIFSFICCIPFLLYTQQPGSTEILWDKWGVPHIHAQNDQELYFSAGYAQMHLRGNLILQLYGKSRGKGAEYWGPEYLETDMLVHMLGFPERAAEWTRTQAPELTRLLQAFVDGMNAYAQTHPDQIETKYRVVLPLTVKDVNQHALFVVYTSFVGGRDLYYARQWEGKGSNTFAVGSSRSASGNAMLVQNPHLPWHDEYTWTEMHFITDEMNLYGATLAGFPMIAIGFNDYLGWSHTDNTIDNADLYELTLENDGYLLEGKVHPFDIQKHTLKILQPDGTYTQKDVERYSSVHGPVLKKSGNSAVAIRMVGLDSPNSFFQWIQMGKAKSLDEFQDALKMAQIPFWNVMYADRTGNIFYLFNGRVPLRKTGGWSYWRNVLDGNNPENLWTEVHPYADLPKVLNPAQGWLQNCNDAPWTSTYPPVLDKSAYPDYMAPFHMTIRAQHASRLLNADPSITFDELVEIKLSTELELAVRILDDLFTAINTYGGELAREAKMVLEKWDRRADPESTGTALFALWAAEAQLFNWGNFATPYDPAKPLTTPDGLRDPEQAVRKLEEVAARLKASAGTLELPWGQVYRLKYNGLDLPASGADGFLGPLRDSGWPNWTDEGTGTVNGGDSWVGIAEFGDRIRAKVLLSYGNSSDPDSPNCGDQLSLYSKMEMRDASFYLDEVRSAMVRKEVLKDGAFVADPPDR